MALKDLDYYRTNPLPRPELNDFKKVFVYSKGTVIVNGEAWATVPSNVLADYRTAGAVIEIEEDKAAYQAARRVYANKANDLIAEFKADLFEMYGLQIGDKKAERAYSIAGQERDGLREVADLFDDLVYLIK